MKTNRLMVADAEGRVAAAPKCTLVHYTGRLASPDIRAFSPLPLVATHDSPQSQEF